MELVVQVQSLEALAAALKLAVGGVALKLPPRPAAGWWAEAKACQAEAQRRGIRFYLVWDGLVKEAERAWAMEALAAVASMSPEALVIRDLGLCRQARRHFPGLKLHAAENWGCLNSLGLRQAQALGFSRVVLGGLPTLKDLALMRRQSSLPLEVVLGQTCSGFSGLCLLPEYLGIDCAFCAGLVSQEDNPGARLAAGFKMLAGLAQLGVEAVQVAGGFSEGEPLGQVVQLYQTVWEASPAARPQVLAAAREVLTAFKESLTAVVGPEEPALREPQKTRADKRGASRLQPEPELRLERRRLWLEARNYGEAVALAREWREPLVLELTPETYRAFLPEHRRWGGRRLIWRLPSVIFESALSFYRKAMETLQQGGYARFVAGDWGAVALVRQVGGEVLGDQTLGVRNSWALKTARELGVAKVCLPPGRRPEDWQELLQQGTPASFWSYVYHFPALAVWPREAAPALSRRRGPLGEKLRLAPEGDLIFLCKEVPEYLGSLGGWLKQHRVAPLILALPRSGLPRGQVPAWVAPEPKRRGLKEV
ncbi:MAG: U32 family peptidase [Desulfobaccales bacterium]|nr:U32 family peptidase [Desulfobaccales bacterium]